MKRIISAILVMIMVLSLCVTAFAAPMAASTSAIFGESASEDMVSDDSPFPLVLSAKFPDKDPFGGSKTAFDNAKWGSAPFAGYSIPIACESHDLVVNEAGTYVFLGWISYSSRRIEGTRDYPNGFTNGNIAGGGLYVCVIYVEVTEDGQVYAYNGKLSYESNVFNKFSKSSQQEGNYLTSNYDRDTKTYTFKNDMSKDGASDMTNLSPLIEEITKYALASDVSKSNVYIPGTINDSIRSWKEMGE